MFRTRYVAWCLLAVTAAGVLLVWMQVSAATVPGVLTIYIESPTGKTVLVDAGPDDSVLQQLPTVMPFMKHSIDVALETHPDSDHITGFIDLLKRYQVGMFIEPGIVKDSATAQSLEKEIDATHTPRYTARRGMVVDLGGGAELDILYPDHDVTQMNPNLDNDGGIVARVLYGNTSVLLTADTDTVVEDVLLKYNARDIKQTGVGELASTILKVAHHGSKYSSEQGFLAAVHPSVALISVGAHNTYGHPAPITLEHLGADNIEVHRTDQEGALVYQSDGQHFVRK
jgi:competence protein ComEC